MAYPRKARWFFDFVSPFSYLHLKLLRRRGDAIELEPVPVLFAGLLKHWGTKGPAELPLKRAYTYRYCTWFAGFQGIPFRFPPRHPFNPLKALRLVVAAGASTENVEKVFDVIFREGLDPESVPGWTQITKSLSAKDADGIVSDPQVKDTLARNTSEAVSQGVFGVPTLELDGEYFWGSDSIDLMDSFIRNPALFQSEEMERVKSLELGAVRRN